jgi:hypothetical protein
VIATRGNYSIAHTGDGEDVAWALDAGEHDALVGAERRYGELAVVEVVACQRVDLALFGHVDQVLDAFAVLGEDDAAVR